MRFKRDRLTLTLQDIACQLSVDAFVEGSVMITGQKVRIRVQLVRAASDSPLWAESYDGQLTDAARLQERVAEDIARHVRSHLVLEDATASASARPVSGVAYEAYLKGRFFWNKRTEADIKKGVEYFKQATALEQEYALAFCGLADSYHLMGLFALWPPHEAYPLAKVAAEQALRLDRDLPEAHAAAAMVRLLYDWDWRGAERQFQRAIELNPNYSIVHQ
jgi:tetratricopeptide (TPR) repeat protein